MWYNLGKQIVQIVLMAILEAETEEHFMTQCTTYHNLRTDMYHSINKIDTTFLCLTPTEKFNFLMTSDIEGIIISVMKFIFMALKHRNMKLSSASNTMRQIKSKK